MLDTINPRDGFWVNVETPFTLPPQVGSPTDLGAADFAALPPGFNLVAIGSQRTPSEFNNSVAAATPSSAQMKFASLWG